MSVFIYVQVLDRTGSALLHLSFGEIYGCDHEDLTHELRQTRRILKRKAELEMVMRLCETAQDLLVSRAACEQSISAAKFIRNNLWTTMLGRRRSHLVVLSTEPRKH